MYSWKCIKNWIKWLCKGRYLCCTWPDCDTVSQKLGSEIYSQKLGEIFSEIGRNIPRNWETYSYMDRTIISKKTFLFSRTNLYVEPEMSIKSKDIQNGTKIFNFCWLTTTKESYFSRHTILIPFDKLSLLVSSVFFDLKRKCFHNTACHLLTSL